MKLNDLECPNCAAHISPTDSEVVHCKYCGTDFTVDKEEKVVQNITINQYYNEGDEDSKKGTKSSANEASSASARSAVPAFFIVIAIFIITAFVLVMGRSKTSNSSTTQISKDPTVKSNYSIPKSEPMRKFVTAAFDKKPEDVTHDEYGKIRYLCIRLTDDLETGNPGWQINYSFTDYNPYSDSFAATMQTAFIDTKSRAIRGSDIISWADFYCFYNLNALDTDFLMSESYDYDTHYSVAPLERMEYIYPPNIMGEGISMLEANPDILKGVTLATSMQSYIDTLKDYPHLTDVRIPYLDIDQNYSALTDLKELKSLQICGISAPIPWLSTLPALEYLTIENANIDDFSPLYTLSNLKYLCLYSCQYIENIDFVQNMPKLEKVDLLYTSISDVSILAKCSNLKAVYLKSNNDIKNISAIEHLLVDENGERL